MAHMNPARHLLSVSPTYIITISLMLTLFSSVNVGQRQPTRKKKAQMLADSHLTLSTRSVFTENETQTLFYFRDKLRVKLYLAVSTQVLITLLLSQGLVPLIPPCCCFSLQPFSFVNNIPQTSQCMPGWRRAKENVQDVNKADVKMFPATVYN